MKTHEVRRWLLWPGVLVALSLMLALPAQAGPRRDSRTRSTRSAPPPPTTSSTTTTPTTYTYTSPTTPPTTSPVVPTVSVATPSTGDINPTSAPVVDDDFEGLVLSVATKPVDELAADEVASLEPVAVEAVPVLAVDVKVKNYSDPALRAQIGAPAANKVAKGRGVVVAVLDAGFLLDHPAIGNRIAVGGWDFVDGDDDPTDYGNGIDDDEDGWTDRAVGHGTMVAAMVLNAAPRTRILPLRVRDDEGKGTDEAVVAAIAHAIEYGVDVINLSIDSEIFDDKNVWEAVEKAKAYGILVVTSAGNDALPYIPLQSIMMANLVVGAVDRDDVVAPFSNYADGWILKSQAIYAPGVDVVGPMAVDGYYTRGTWSGTSFAAGVVSGAVALLKELHPDWGVTDLQRAVAASVVSVRLPNGKVLGTSGRVDLTQVVAR